MSRLWTICKREYLENVRTKAFLLGIVLTPVWVGLILVVPKLMKTQTRQDRIVVVDETKVLASVFEGHLLRHAAKDRFQIERVDPETYFGEDTGDPMNQAALLAAAGRGELFTVVLTASLLDKRAPKPGENIPGILGPPNVGALETGRLLTAAVDAAANDHLVERYDLDPEISAKLQTPVVDYKPVTESGRRARGAQMITPILFMLLLFMGIVGISQMLINSTLEEKSNRVYEVLLSSVSAFELMAGKLLGICGVGFTLLLLWAGGGFITAQASGMSDLVSGGQLGWLLAFYVAGFLLIASLMVAVGSACNTIKEAQNLMAPISFLLAMPMLLSMLFLNDPNGPMATVCSFIPPFTPFVMMARITSVPAPPPEQVWLAFGLLLLATVLAVRLAARIFRVGILMHGQPPSLRQIWRWLKG